MHTINTQDMLKQQDDCWLLNSLYSMVIKYCTMMYVCTVRVYSRIKVLRKN